MISRIWVKNLIVIYKIWVKQKELYSYAYMSDFEKFKIELPSKEKFSSSLIGKKSCDKKCEHVLKVCKLEIK